jgi:hypothetical protein
MGKRGKQAKRCDWKRVTAHTVQSAPSVSANTKSPKDQEGNKGKKKQKKKKKDCVVSLC